MRTVIVIRAEGSNTIAVVHPPWRRIAAVTPPHIMRSAAVAPRCCASRSLLLAAAEVCAAFAVPSEDYSHGPPCSRALSVKGERPDRTTEFLKKTMKTKTNRQPKTTSELQSRPEPRSTGTRPKINFAVRRTNRSLATEQVLTLLRNDTPRFFAMAEVIGKWVWIQFTDKQPSDTTRTLAELGFHWNNARQTWQHPCGTAAFDRATYDPRHRYGSYFAASRKERRVTRTATKFATTATRNATQRVVPS